MSLHEFMCYEIYILSPKDNSWNRSTNFDAEIKRSIVFVFIEIVVFRQRFHSLETDFGETIDHWPSAVHRTGQTDFHRFRCHCFQFGCNAQRGEHTNQYGRHSGAWNKQNDRLMWLGMGIYSNVLVIQNGCKFSSHNAVIHQGTTTIDLGNQQHMFDDQIKSAQT